jgi:hypothetical protein
MMDMAFLLLAGYWPAKHGFHAIDLSLLLAKGERDCLMGYVRESRTTIDNGLEEWGWKRRG